MLPHKLSNGICSLNQGEDRLALSCIMEIDENGNIISHEIVETLINVDRRMSYTQVRDVLIGEKEACEKHKDFISMFKLMKELSDILCFTASPSTRKPPTRRTTPMARLNVKLN